MVGKEWRVLVAPPAGFSDSIGLPVFQAHLLYNRGIRNRSEMGAFLRADASLLNDPMLLPDMERGVARLQSALRSSETIGVFGDFDTDGITGTALLARALRDLGAHVVTYIPDRVDEGHGLNDVAIRRLSDKSVSLMLTVDCGATSISEIEVAASLGIDTIITDHHTVLTELPNACAVINPKRADSRYPYGELTGVGMSFKLVEALYAELGREWPGHLLELVALGTVADVGPLTGENRYMVKEGLERLNTSESPGIRALAAVSGQKLGSLDTESLSFGLIPRLNSAGRLGHAGVSLELLTATSMATAEPMAQQLDRKNSERQRVTETAVREARKQVEAEMTAGGAPPIIIVSGRDWIPGILGLIAGRLSDTHYRPVVAVGLGEEVSRASARSIAEFDIVAALADSQQLLTRFGGHPQAAGFAVPTTSLPLLVGRLKERAERQLGDLSLAPAIEVDCEAELSALLGDNFGFIQSLAPFGAGNHAPVFLTRNARAVDARQVGGGGRHLKMRVAHNGTTLDAIAFRQGDMLDATRGRIDLVYNVTLDTWGYRPKIQLHVIDLKPSA